MHTLTPWSATAQEALQNNEILLEKTIHNQTYQFFNTGDFLWIVAVTPENNRIAFRAAFAMSSCFEVENIFDGKDTIVVSLNSRLGNCEVRVNFPDSNNPMLHYTTTFTARIPLIIPFWPRDVMPLTQNGSVENTFGQIHMQQAGTRTGLLYASMSKPKKGSLFYFQNLTSISAYCEATKTELCDAVGGKWPEIGFRLPQAEESPLPAGVALVLSDAYILLRDDFPDTPSEISAQFLSHLASVYSIMPKPELEYHHWPDIAQKVLHDLYHNKGCWTQTNGCPYLNAYLCDYDTPG
ncbi:hypothetical protein EV144_106331 [Flavobacterium sp. 270]|uniref:hypothetical protein n=1 Tax=Flavobacterium sp. 270 TaxID=2512114 RepID=UPI0010DA763F|nr:hypothetical protein [Flavobacterium sp. 270]TDW46657.1 hypothetical protein EV144_106331 [Flavobacterium sp. 270]